MENSILKPFKFMGRGNKYVMNTYYLFLLCNKGNLKETILKARMHGADQFIEEEFVRGNALLPGLSQEEREESIQKLKNAIKEGNENEVEDFLPILFNETMVMMCTVFETFLQDCISVLIDNKPQYLKSLSHEKDINIPQIIDASSYSQIFQIIKNKFLKRFDFMSIDKKISVFTSIGLDREIIFKFNQKMILKFPSPDKFLENIFNKRNDIVHKDFLPIKTMDELFEVSEFLNYFFIKLSMDMFKKFNILTDMHQLLKNK